MLLLNFVKDDYVLFIRGKCVPTINELIESAITVLLHCDKDNGLDVNPVKIELILPENINEPRLAGILK